MLLTFLDGVKYGVDKSASWWRWRFRRRCFCQETKSLECCRQKCKKNLSLITFNLDGNTKSNFDR